jgi:hypothetical protein
MLADRTEVAAVLAPAFDTGQPWTHHLIATARAAHAPASLLVLLRRLPDRRFSSMSDVWFELTNLATTGR